MRSSADATLDLAARTGWALHELPARHTIRTDPEAAGAAAVLAARLLARRAVGTCERHPRGQPLSPQDIAIGVTHRDQADQIRQALTRVAPAAAEMIRVDTANRLQGAEFEVTIVLHPLSGRRDATAFHLEAGRLCVLASRHRHACIVVARAGIADAPRRPPLRRADPPRRPRQVSRRVGGEPRRARPSCRPPGESMNLKSPASRLLVTRQRLMSGSPWHVSRDKRSRGYLNAIIPYLPGKIRLPTTSAVGRECQCQAVPSPQRAGRCPAVAEGSELESEPPVASSAAFPAVHRQGQIIHRAALPVSPCPCTASPAAGATCSDFRFT